MATFYLVRHGEAQWDLAGARKLKGWGNDLVPLTAQGVRQIADVAERLHPVNAQLILSSPMTRSLQSAAILSRMLDVSLHVELDLHEWVPDMTFNWDSFAVVLAAAAERERLDGEWPVGAARDWEPLSRVVQRVHHVLQQFSSLERVIVVCHEIVIYALTGNRVGLAEMCEYRMQH